MSTTLTVASLAAPKVRPQVEKVRMHRYMMAAADEMNAAVVLFDALPAWLQRFEYNRICDLFAASRPKFGLVANRQRLSVLSKPSDVKKANAKIGKNGLNTLSLTVSSAGSCRVEHEGVVLELNTCRWAGLCGPLCVLSHGRGSFSTVRAARNWRTFCLWLNPADFAVGLRFEILQANAKGHFLARMNVNSDLPWAAIGALFEGVDMFAYDYTKDPQVLDGDGWLLPNYRVIYSHSERTDAAAEFRFLARGGSVAWVTNRVKGAPVGSGVIVGDSVGNGWFPLVDGDLSDDRYTTAAGVVVDLYAKGKARNRRSKFVVEVY